MDISMDIHIHGNRGYWDRNIVTSSTIAFSSTRVCFTSLSA